MKVTAKHYFSEDLYDLQATVRKWVLQTLGEETLEDPHERALRFFEEAVELCQAVGVTQEELIAVMRYVLNRPVGEKEQEISGVLVTLLALSSSLKVEAANCLHEELERIHKPEVQERVRKRQAEKREIPLLTSDTLQCPPPPQEDS